MDSIRRRALALAVLLDEEEEKSPKGCGFTIFLKKRKEYGECHHLFHELGLDDERFQLYFRLSRSLAALTECDIDELCDTAPWA